MKRSPYGERDYAFGQLILTLRTNIGLTQAGLAERLGISRQAVGEWEGGLGYPKAEHLKAFIALCMQQQVWAIGHEAEEIRSLWRAAHQKVLLDELWLHELLSLPTHPSMSVAVEQTCVANQASVPQTSDVPRVDWGEAIDVPTFYGRRKELALLSRWVVEEHCRVVSVLGMGGIGKSALAVTAMHRVARQFEVVIWRSLRDAPSCNALLDECLQVLAPQPLRDVAASLEERLRVLLAQMRARRVLLVLDNLEMLLEVGTGTGRMRGDLEGYDRLLQGIGETAHQSCLLLTSREKPAALVPLEGSRSPVRALRLAGLDAEAGAQLLAEKDVVGTTHDRVRLIEAYRGNPLALKIVAQTIVELFGGEIVPFLVQGEVVFGGVRELLDGQFNRLSVLERSVLLWLAILREPVSLQELLAVLSTPRAPVQVLEALDGLGRRSLIERGQRAGSFTLQSVVLEYVTARLVAEGSQEIELGHLGRLIEHGLSLAHAKEYVRQAQERLVLSPLLAKLQRTYSGHVNRGTGASSLSVEEKLLSLLDGLRGQKDSVQGYGPANLVALLRLLRGNLSGLNLSQLCIRGAYLQGIEMQDTQLSGALICDTVLTEAATATYVVAISCDGKRWAAGGIQGKVRLWEGIRPQTLLPIWQAHAHIVETLAFSPDGHLLASGGTDGTIKIWNVEDGTLLWTNWHKSYSLAFTPDSRLLASAEDTTVCLWDPETGRKLQTLMHPRSVHAVAFSPDGSLLASGCFDGQIRLWQRQTSASSHYVEIRSMQGSWMGKNLAFAPDGRILASTNVEKRILLWDVSTGELLTTLPGQGQTAYTQYLAWSPDGRILAHNSDDHAIWLWDVQEGRYRGSLVGHVANVYSMAFTPDSGRLLSGSQDRTLRVWEIQSGECIHIIQGYGVSLSDLDWSPDGRRMVSSSTNGLVTIWDLSGRSRPRELRGHRWMVDGVAWSPDGKWLASGGWDASLRLWDLISGASLPLSQDPSIFFSSVAWNSDGSLLACGTYQRGVQVWDVTTRRLRWIGQPYQDMFRRVAWSPDGTRLVGTGGQGSVYIWESESGTLLQHLQQHHGRVTSVAWSPDGRWLASGSRNRESGEVFVWDMERGTCVQTFLGHIGMVSALTWSRSHGACPREGRLVSGGSDGQLLWWDRESGACVCTQAAHQGMIHSLKVSPDGKRLASCGDDGAIRIWDLESGEHLRTLRHDRPYERLNITDIRGLNEAQKESLRALGAIDEARGSP